VEEGTRVWNALGLASSEVVGGFGSSSGVRKALGIGTRSEARLVPSCLVRIPTVQGSNAGRMLHFIDSLSVGDGQPVKVDRASCDGDQPVRMLPIKSRAPHIPHADRKVLADVQL
jgi:hypothetical protein